MKNEGRKPDNHWAKDTDIKSRMQKKELSLYLGQLPIIPEFTLESELSGYKKWWAMAFDINNEMR